MKMTTDFSLHQDVDSCPIKEPEKKVLGIKKHLKKNIPSQETTSSPLKNGCLGDHRFLFGKGPF